MLDLLREIDDIENLQGIGFLMAGTEDIANDDVEVPLYASPANVLKLLKVEQKRNKLDSQKNELQQQADSAISSLYKNILLYVAYTGGIIYFHTTELPSAIAFNVSILSMCLFMTGLFFHTSWAKSMITRRDGYIEFFAERHKRLRVDARILVELENNRRRRRLAANIADNSEGPLIDMASFMTRCKTIYDAADFYDFLKVYHKKINLSWVLGGVYVLFVLIIAFFNYYYKQGQDYSFSD